VVDTGVDLAHPDLAGKIVSGFDFVNSDAIPQDDNGHGTHVAGIAAATGNNGVGVAGTSWGAQIMPVKVLDAAGNGTFANVAAGIVWATDNGAQVINLSLGGNAPSAVLQSAVDYAYNSGRVIVAAVGNTGNNSILYPARYPNVVAVAATDSANNRAAFSNYGPEVSVAAPGAFIYSTLSGGAYGYRSGTSMSTAYVSGLAAILVGELGAWSPGSIRSVLQTTALDLGAPGRDDFYGFGLIQMDAALQTALATPTLPPAPTALPLVDTQPPLPPPTDTLQPTDIPSPTFTAPPFASVSAAPLTPEVGVAVLPTFTSTPSLTPTAIMTQTFTATSTATRTFTPTVVRVTVIHVPPLPATLAPNSVMPLSGQVISVCGCGWAGLLLLLAVLIWRRRRARADPNN
jgi:subtilisin family serine protease